MILAASEAWALPPWVIEAVSPALWLDRLQLYVAAKEAREITRAAAMMGAGRGKGRPLGRG